MEGDTTLNTNPRLIPVERGHSFFSFISEYCHEEASRGYPNAAIHRLCTLMRKMNVKTAVIEDISDTDDAIKDEYSALSTYFDDTIEERSYKLTFVSEKISSPDEIQKIEDHSFLASAIIINFKIPSRGWRSYLYSAFVTTPKITDHSEIDTLPLLNNYLHIYKSFKCSLSVSDKDIR